MPGMTSKGSLSSARKGNVQVLKCQLVVPNNSFSVAVVNYGKTLLIQVSCDLRKVRIIWAAEFTISVKNAYKMKECAPHTRGYAPRDLSMIACSPNGVCTVISSVLAVKCLSARAILGLLQKVLKVDV